MAEHLFYSPQAQLDLDEIYDYFANELNNPRKGQGIVEDILAAAERVPGRALRYPIVGPLPFTMDEPLSRTRSASSPPTARSSTSQRRSRAAA